MTTTPTLRVWLGGSFDPVHVGHVAMLQHVYQCLHQAVPDWPIVASFLPTAGSPLKNSPTANAHRLAMLECVLADVPDLALDDSEIHQSPPVYTIDTLTAFAKRYPDDVRIFVLGGDSAASLSRWRHGDVLLDWANLWVMARTGQSHMTPHALATTLAQFFAAKQNILTKQACDLINSHTNLIFIDDFVPPMVASRDIRAWLADLGQMDGACRHATAPRDALLASLNAALPAAVLAYILQHGLYGTNPHSSGHPR